MPNLWGSAGGNGFMSDPRKRAGLSGTMIGLAQGLLSQQQGESWASALGRGFGQAGALSRQYQDDVEQSSERQREQAMRDDFTRMAEEATNPRDKQMFSIMASAPPGQAAQLYGQYAMAQSGMEEAESRRVRGVQDAIAKGMFERGEKEKIQIVGEERRAARKDADPEEMNRDEAALILRVDTEDPQNPDLEARAALGLTPDEPLPEHLRERMFRVQSVEAIKALVNRAVGYRDVARQPGNPLDVPGS